MNYYNEIDPLKAEVLREAIKHGAIAPGDVDERSVSDVRAGDVHRKLPLDSNKPISV